jgi:hypothetical protein
MSTKRTHIVIPEKLAAEIDTLVGKRGRSHFLANAAWRELKRLRQLASLEQAIGTWQAKDHPELKQGTQRWVSKLRAEGDSRILKFKTE